MCQRISRTWARVNCYSINCRVLDFVVHCMGFLLFYCFLSLFRWFHINVETVLWVVQKNWSESIESSSERFQETLPFFSFLPSADNKADCLVIRVKVVFVTRRPTAATDLPTFNKLRFFPVMSALFPLKSVSDWIFTTDLPFHVTSLVS